jgi:hypothetical protein
MSNDKTIGRDHQGNKHDRAYLRGWHTIISTICESMRCEFRRADYANDFPQEQKELNLNTAEIVANQSIRNNLKPDKAQNETSLSTKPRRLDIL